MEKSEEPRKDVKSEYELELILETSYPFDLKTLKKLKEKALTSYRIFYTISGGKKGDTQYARVSYHNNFHEREGISNIPLTLIKGKIADTETSFKLYPGENGSLNLEFSRKGKRKIRGDLTKLIEEFFSQ